MSLSILNDPQRDASQKFFETFQTGNVLERLRRIAAAPHLEPDEDPLVPLGTEINGGKVTKNSLGFFDLAWKAAENPGWAAQIRAEVAAIQEGIRETHGTALRFIIWAGMGGSVEDKTMYNAAHLLKGGPRLYSLDSTDPAKLKAIIEDMQSRSGLQLPEILRATLVVGMALGMTSYEPVVNLEKLAGLYDKFGIDSRPNFLYLTLPGSILDNFAGPRGYRKVEMQLDNGNSTSGRHSAPLTRGSLYPLAFAGVDLEEWIAATNLSGDDIQTAWKLAAFLHAQGLEGRDKVTLLLPKSWASAGLWTKQNFEESLGKSEYIGLKIVIQEKVSLAHYRRVDDPRQDRVFLVIQRKGEAHPDADRITSVRQAKYPVAALTFSASAPLSRYMQMMHFAVAGLGILRDMNFVTQPGVELYKAIAGEVFAPAREAGGIENTEAWKKTRFETDPRELAAKIRKLADAREIEYGELTYFGDMRYNEEGQAVRHALERAADRIFRSRLKMPVDLYEGPAMNHSYHEMIIGHGKCFSIVIIAARPTRFPVAHYEPDYHMAQFLATKMALERRGRHVVAVRAEDAAQLEAFLSEVASYL